MTVLVHIAATHFTMYDSYGDGWNGNTFDVYDASGTLVSSSTLSTGSSGTDVLCLDDACYDFLVWRRIMAVRS